MNDYLAKPLDRERLFAVIAAWTGAAVPAGKDDAAGPPARTAAPEGIETRLRTVAGLDVDEGLYRLGGKAGIYCAILVGFAAGGRDYLRQVRQALAEGRPEQARDVAHKLAGAAGNVSAVEVRDMAWAMEESLASGRAKEAAFLLASLERAMETVAQGIGVACASGDDVADPA